MGCFFRIQKLLTCEYKELEETVLAESPFAQVSDSGIGIRQVQLALTPTKLLIAADSFSKELSNDFSNVYFMHEDPEIESLELVSLYPLDYLEIQIYKTELRELMAITLPNQKELFFEFGGHFLKHLYYNIWRDRISNRELFITVEDESGSTSREYGNSRKLQVLADVHANPGSYDDASKYEICEKENAGREDIFERDSNIFPFKGTCLYKTMASDLNSTSWSTISLPEKSQRNRRQEFMETRSDTVMGDRTCRGDCMENHFKTTSNGDIYSCWTTWN